jgi:hypothetical protein
MVDGDADGVSSSTMVAVVGVGIAAGITDEVELLVRRNAEPAMITSAPIARMSIFEFMKYI